MSQISFRDATLEDLAALSAIYIDAVDTIGPRAYTPAQIAAWRRWPIDSPDEVKQRVFAGTCRLAEFDGTPVAFAVFTSPDHLDFLYTKGQFAGRGLATQLHQQLEAVARDQDAVMLRTEASHLSRPVFTRLGYEVVEIEDVVRFEASFRRFKMRKILRPKPPATSLVLPCRSGHQPSFENAPQVMAEATAVWIEDDTKNPGWFKGKTAEGTEGYFPRAWFHVDEDSGHATALRDYDASELAVAPGEPIGVIETESGWSRVVNATQKIGWVPHHCTTARIPL